MQGVDSTRNTAQSAIVSIGQQSTRRPRCINSRIWANRCLAATRHHYHQWPLRLTRLACPSRRPEASQLQRPLRLRRPPSPSRRIQACRHLTQLHWPLHSTRPPFPSSRIQACRHPTQLHSPLRLARAAFRCRRMQASRHHFLICRLNSRLLRLQQQVRVMRGPVSIKSSMQNAIVNSGRASTTLRRSYSASTPWFRSIISRMAP
mmetsp:Transcript_86977/g.137273  ORF Transcript_86977/g.137273 Transcript_86977/m.137273 type:complete len:205 (-) Transcript_86977:156-770(-)